MRLVHLAHVPRQIGRTTMFTDPPSDLAFKQSLSAATIFDPAPAEEIRALDPDGATRLLQRIVRRFIEGLPEQLAAMRAQGDDGRAIARRAAHSLKSAAAQLGAKRLALHAARVEEYLRDGHVGGAESLCDELRIAAEEVMPHLEALAR